MDKDYCVLGHSIFGVIWKCYGDVDHIQAQTNANSNQLSYRQYGGEFNATFAMHVRGCETICKTDKFKYKRGIIQIL